MKKRVRRGGHGLVIHVEPDGYVVCTRGGRKIKRCRTMESAMRFCSARLEKTGGRSVRVAPARLKYVPAAKAAKAKKRKPARRVKRRATKRRSRR